MSNAYYINWKKMEVNQNNDGTPVNPLVALMFSAMVGGLFVVFLPFIGLYLFAKHALVGPVVKWTRQLTHAAIVPVAEPGAAYLTGAKGNESKAAENTLEDLEKEINSRR